MPLSRPHRKTGLLLLFAALSMSCERGSGVPPPDDPGAVDERSEHATPPMALPAPPHLADVRYLFEERCSHCHLPEATDAEAPPSALAVFNLNDPAFTDGLSDAQLVEGRRRLFEDNLPGADQALVDEWLRAEWRWRDRLPRRYPPALRARAPMDPVVTPAGGCVGTDCWPGR